MKQIPNTRQDYLRLWNEQHPGYKSADSRRRALFRPARRAFYREILGVNCQVNPIPLAKGAFIMGEHANPMPTLS